MRRFFNSTTTRTKGWQADCWNWASKNLPFELHGVEDHHLPFCHELSEACHCKCRSHSYRGESVAVFEPAEKLCRAKKLPERKLFRQSLQTMKFVNYGYTSR